MEIKKQKLYVTKTNKFSLYVSSKWLAQMGIDKDNRNVQLIFTDNKIIIEALGKDNNWKNKII